MRRLTRALYLLQRTVRNVMYQLLVISLEAAWLHKCNAGLCATCFANPIREAMSGSPLTYLTFESLNTTLQASGNVAI